MSWDDTERRQVYAADLEDLKTVLLELKSQPSILKQCFSSNLKYEQ